MYSITLTRHRQRLHVDVGDGVIFLIYHCDDAIFAHTLHVEVLYVQCLIIIVDFVTEDRLGGIAHHWLLHVCGKKRCSHEHSVIAHDKIIILYHMILIQIIVIKRCRITPTGTVVCPEQKLTLELKVVE